MEKGGLTREKKAEGLSGRGRFDEVAHYVGGDPDSLSVRRNVEVLL